MMKLSTRITLGILLVSTVLMSVFGALLIHEDRVSLHTILMKQSKALAQSIAAYSVELLVSEDYPSLEMALKTIGHEDDSVVYIEVSQNDRIVARYGKITDDNVLTTREDVVLHNIDSKTRTIGEVKLLVSELENDVIIANHIRSMVAYMVLSLVCFSIILRYALGRLVVQRIEHLKLLTEDVIATELPGRIPLSSLGNGHQDEIDLLQERFSSMLEGLQSRDRARNAMLLEIAAARSLLEDVTCAMPSALIVVNRDGIISFCNSTAISASENFGEVMEGKPLRAAFPYSAEHIQTILDAVRKHKTIKKMSIVKKISDTSHFFEVAVYPLSSTVTGGAVIHVVDVTERVRVEEVMMQTNKMVSIGGLAAGIAHEINNPLGVMMQAAQNIERRVSVALEVNHQAAAACGTTVDTIRCYLEKRNILAFLDDIKSDGARAAKIVRSLLEFSRNSESKRDLIPIAALFNQVVELAQKDYDPKNNVDFRQINVVIDVEPSLDFVPMVRSQIEQVLLNLLSNSAYVLSQKMRTALTEGRGFLPKIVLHARREGQWAHMEVRDNGIGFSEEARIRAFEPFFTTKPPGVGTGLGLWIAYVIVVDKHGGEITLDSIPNEGSTFVIKLPLEGSV